ncbi:MAG TPA: protease modulator HflK, partial [Accumulibacter sp.]|nr:protease modulator HflK [Accumulibacter sp.]
GQGNLLYLPLDKFMQAAAAGAASTTPAPAAGSAEQASTPARPGPVVSNEVPPQVVEKSETRSRENLRQRDREAR